MTHNLRTSNRYFLIPICLALIVLADYLFYGHPLGWDTALFIGIAAATVAFRSPGLWRKTAGRIALALTALILLALIEEPSSLAILMSLFTLGLLILIAHGGWTTSFTAWFIRWLHLFLTVPIRTILDTRIAARWLKNRPAQRPRSFRVILLWFIPILAGAVFLILFAFANPIIEQWAANLWNDLKHIVDWLPEFLQPARIALWLFTGITAYGLLRYRARNSRISQINIPPIINPRPSNAHQFIIRCLIVFNLVFAVQTTLDIIYLFGGVQLPAGMTYASYAHRGAYPLVATALLAGIFVLLAFRTDGPAHRSPLARRLVFLWLAQNIFLMFSTLFRTWLYIAATLLTELRVSVFIWVFLIAAGFLLIAVKIRTHRSNGWLCLANAIHLFAVLYVCAFINFPGLIADFNVHHCQEITNSATPLDINYLEHLGPAALPSLHWVQPLLPEKSQSRLLTAESHLNTTLTQSLSDWRSWTFRRERLSQTADARSTSARSTTFRLEP